MCFIAAPGVLTRSMAQSTDGQAMTAAEVTELAERLDRLEEAVSGLGGGITDTGLQLVNQTPFDALSRRVAEIEEAVRGLVARVDALAGGANAAQGSASELRGAAPSPLGQRPADSTGQPLNLLSPDVSAAQQSAAPAQSPVLATTTSEAPRDHYDAAYGLVLEGDYESAETSFRDFLQRYPDSEFAGNAAFWVGETLYLRDRHADAARTFLDVSQRYPNGPKAAESLLKLGLSLTALGQPDAACSSYRELLQRYPDAPREVVDRAEREFYGTGC